MADSGAQTQIILWTTPRSLSTAFLRCMMHRDRCECYMEPMLPCYYMGPERQSARFQDEPDRPGATFRENKQRLESPHEGYKEVFVKDHTYRLKKFFDSGTLTDVVPEGYVHTFLIRNPRAFVPSLYVAQTKGTSGFDYFNPADASLKQSIRMHEYASRTLGQKSVIVDADDLMQDPKTILRLYCDAVGIDFQDSMVHWPPMTAQHRAKFLEWEEADHFMKAVFESTGIRKKSPTQLPDVETQPWEVQECIRENLPLYQTLYDQRLRLPDA